MLRSDPRIHYKMYKAKKDMVYATLFSFAVLGGLGFSQNAKADTVENTASQPVVTTVGNSNITSAPTSQPTTDVTTSHAANVNTANSAPTAQPVAAQSVSNSNTNSASNVADQTQMTPLNVQSAQPTPNSAAINRAKLYTQSLVQENQNQAQVSQITLTHDNTPLAEGDTQNIQTDSSYAYGINAQFTVTADQLSHSQYVNLGRVTFQSDGNYQPGVLALGAKLMLKDKYVGAVGISLPNQPMGDNLLAYQHQPYFDIVLHVDNPVSVIGDQSFTVNYPYLFRLGYNQAGYRGMPADGANIKAVLTANGVPTQTYQFHATWNDKLKPIDLTDANKASGIFWGLGDDQSQLLTVAANNYGFASDKDRTDFYQSHGQSTPNMNANEPIQVGMHVYGTDGTSLIINQSSRSTAAGYMPMANSSGVVIDEVQQAHQDANKHPVAIQKFEDGLSVSQLAAKNFHGWAYSRQNDGSYNVYISLIPKDYQMSADEINDKYNTATINDYSTTVNRDSNPAGAAEATKAANAKLQYIPTTVQTGLWFELADPSVVNHFAVDRIDPITNKVIKTIKGNSYVNSSMASGQAAVKLHVINATNGTELNQWRKLMSEARNKKK